MESLGSGPSPPHDECSWQAKGNLQGASDSNDSNAGNLSPLTPPYWLHHRHGSFASAIDTKPAPITLEDHTEEPSEQEGVVWAKGVYIEDHVVVSGNMPNVGDFVVWKCRIDTIDGSTIIVRKRYSEFLDLREKLLMTFPGSGGAMPPFPPRSLICEQA